MPLGFHERPTPEALQKRNAELRRMVLACVSPGECESALVDHLLRGQDSLFPSHPLLVAYEWHVVPGMSQYGVGDLVFANDHGDLAVVEVKWIPQESGKNPGKKRTKKRSLVREQALRYAEALWRRISWVGEVEARTWTNDRDDLPLVGRYGPLTATSPLARAIERAVWDSHPEPRHIVPSLGESFGRARSGELRVAVVSLMPPPDRGTRRMTEPETERELERIAGALSTVEGCVSSRFALPESLYLTSAVKVHSDGLKPASSAPTVYDGRRTWGRELHTLAQFGALPHVVVVHGVRAWEAVLAPFANPWRFWPDGFPGRLVLGPKPLAARLAKVSVETPNGAEEVLLVRLPDPGSPNRRWSAEQLVSHEAFQRFIE